MLSVQALKEYGANTDQALGRCMNNEDFYLRLVGMVLKEPGFGQLRALLEAGDLDKAFSVVHNLKGMVGNLSLDPLYGPICELTELLRGRTQTDYAPLLTQIEERFAALSALAE
jgi:HPt (histidine-containing phosphotransfer) domain-containing protein